MYEQESLAAGSADERVSYANTVFARTLVASFSALGARDVIISPGSRSTPLVLALARRSQVRCHRVLDERAAAFVALGLARTSGDATLLVATSGSAAAHYLPAVIEASESRVPLIILSADRPQDLEFCGANQTIDQTRLFASFVRFFFDAHAQIDPTYDQAFVAALARRAWTYAHHRPRGPVHLNIRFREPLWSLASEACGFEAEVLGDIPHDDAPQVIDKGAGCYQYLTTVMSRAERGVVVCGGLDIAGRPRAMTAATAITRLADRLDWPVIADPTSLLRFREGGARGLICAADLILADRRVASALAPDCILRFGRFPLSKRVGEWLRRFGAGCTYLVDPIGEWRDPTHQARAIITAEAGECAAQLAEVFRDISKVPDGRSNKPTYRQQWQEAVRQSACALDRVIKQAGESLWEGEIVRRVVAALPSKTHLHIANSMPIRDIDAFCGVSGRDIFVTANRGASGIDGVMATAGGAALAHRGARMPGLMVLLTGDLSFLHDIGGLAAVMQLPINLTIVVINNAGGAIFEFLEIAKHPRCEADFVTPQQSQIDQICRALGATYRLLKNYGELDDVLSALGSSAHTWQCGITVLELRVAREENLRQHALADQAIGEILHRWLDLQRE